MGRQLLPRHKCPRSRQCDRKSGLTNVSVALFISPTYQSHSESRSLSKVCSQVRHSTDSIFALRKESYVRKYSKMFQPDISCTHHLQMVINKQLMDILGRKSFSKALTAHFWSTIGLWNNIGIN